MSFLSNLFSAVASLLGWVTQRDSEHNTAEMQANAAAASRQASVDAATQIVADSLARPDDPKALEELRKKVAK